MLERADYLNPPRLRSKDIGEIAFRSEGAALGEFTLGASGGRMVASGWGVLPDRGRTADSILLTYDDAQGRSMIFARADVGEPRRELRDPFQYNRFNESGWSKGWNRRDLPADPRRISAWVFDAEECRAYKIGEASVN
jgi:hypothetical protein